MESSNAADLATAATSKCELHQACTLVRLLVRASLRSAIRPCTTPTLYGFNRFPTSCFNRLGKACKNPLRTGGRMSIWTRSGMDTAAQEMLRKC